MIKALSSALSLAVLLLAGGCAQPPEAPVGLLDVTSRPAEKALLAGIRAYEDGQYAESEKQLGAALQAGLASPRDAAAAHKHLAFIYCTSNRAARCEAAFREARKVDPSFVLSRSEQGHPLWGPTYKRVLP
jgi:Tfp pilus assembly protein PilF